MARLPHSEKISKISLFVLAQLTNVTDRRTDGRTPRAGNSHAVHSIARQKFIGKYADTGAFSKQLQTLLRRLLLMTDDWSMIIHLFVLLPRSGDSNCFASPVFVCFCLFVCLFLCYDICYDVTTATWREKQLSCETFKIHCVSKKRAKFGKLYIVETTACRSWLVFETQCRRAMAKVLCH